MALNLPARLKSADIQRFAFRASQLQNAKPVIAYWCEYWIVNQLIARGLHTTDEECLQYTTSLMDKLEQTKAKYNIVDDDIAAQGEVEQFALDTFERADRAVQADKVTKQTADTFLAAATFFELVNIWGEPSPEIHAKIRYSKWNAVRITKAVKEGQDPNDSNPKPAQEPLAEDDLQPLDPNDPEVQALQGNTGAAKQASVEDVPDEQDRVESHLAAQSHLDRSLHPSAQPSAQPSPRPSAGYTHLAQGGLEHDISNDEVSPLEPSPNERDGSVGGGYFPEVPSTTRSPILPYVPADHGPGAFSPPDLPDPSQLPPPSSHQPSGFPSFSPPPTQPQIPPPQDYYRHAQPPPSGYPLQPQHPQAPIQPQTPQYSAALDPYRAPTIQPPAAAPAPYATQPSGKPTYNTDDVAIAKAQKHARWAISALNFEDAETAVKELRGALQTLGAL